MALTALNCSTGSLLTVMGLSSPPRAHQGGDGRAPRTFTSGSPNLCREGPVLESLNEVSAGPLRQAPRPQQAGFTAFFEKRTRYPSFKSRRSRQSATYTRAAFRMKDGTLHLAKMSASLRFVWSWPDMDAA